MTQGDWFLFGLLEAGAATLIVVGALFALRPRLLFRNTPPTRQARRVLSLSGVFGLILAVALPVAFRVVELGPRVELAVGPAVLGALVAGRLVAAPRPAPSGVLPRLGQVVSAFTLGAALAGMAEAFFGVTIAWGSAGATLAGIAAAWLVGAPRLVRTDGVAMLPVRR